MIIKQSSIFTTGAFLKPLQLIDNNGNTLWRWVVTSFEDDSYLNGKICRPEVSAETCDKLLLPDDDDDDDVVDDVVEE
jgi:hypothetical protein